MARSLFLAFLAGALLLSAAIGCGGDEPSDEDEAAAALEAFLDALRAGDSAAVCDRLASETLDDLEQSGSCQVVMASGLELISAEGVEIPPYEISEVSVDGDRAEGTLAGVASENMVPLVREEGEWRVTGATSLDQFHPDSPLDSDSGQGEVGG